MMNINVSKSYMWANTELFNPEHSDLKLAAAHESSITQNSNRAFFRISLAIKQAWDGLSEVNAHATGKHNPAESDHNIFSCTCQENILSIFLRVVCNEFMFSLSCATILRMASPYEDDLDNGEALRRRATIIKTQNKYNTIYTLL